MKKILALVLLLTMLTAPLMTASASEKETYTHHDALYSFEYPADFILITAETLPGLLESLESGELKIGNLDANTLKAQGGILLQNDQVMLMSADGVVSMTFTCLELGQEFTDVDALLYLCPTRTEQYQQAYADLEVIEQGTFVTYGFRMMTVQSFHTAATGVGMEIRIVYDAAGTKLQLCEIVLPDLLTGTDREYAEMVIEDILASFRYASDVQAQ